MTQTESYFTISSSSSGLFKEKGSKFLAFAYHVNNETEVKPILDILKKQHFSAQHICFAYKLGSEKILSRTYDDREPSGTAGKPILGQINAFNLTNILIVVVRYFGGVLLGTGGLINAYRSASAEAISKASIVNKFVLEHYSLIFNHNNMNQVMKIIKDNQVDYSEQHFDENCQMKVKIKKNEKKTIIAKLSAINNLQIEFLFVE
jgi:uncharacterized YigZ family protein